MAIRSTLKSILKRLLQGNANSQPETKPVSYDHFPSQHTNTGTTNTPPKKSVESLETPVVSTVVTPSLTDTNSVVTNAHTEPVPPVSPTKIAPSQTDTTGATFVFAVQNLFPETCPHCQSSSYANWTRIDNKFACASCETTY